MEQWERKRRFLMVIPVLVLPFTAFLFWVLGGGTIAVAAPTAPPGINSNLPSAQLKSDEPGDKMSLYNQADQDSLALQEQLRNDPFRQDQLNHPAEISLFSADGLGGTESAYLNPPTDASEQNVRQKLALLNQQIEKESVAPNYQNPIEAAESMYKQKDQDIAQLEEMMKALGNPAAGNGADPELAQLNGMLEKVLDIQHPDRMKEKLRTASAKDKSRVFPVRRQSSEILDDLLKTPDTSKLSTKIAAFAARETATGFLGIEDVPSDVSNNGITAVIHQNQTLVSGAIIKLRTTQDMYLHGKLIPSGTFISGNCNLSGERLQIAIENIRYQDAVYPVDLIVFSLDGISGIHIPGAITRDAAKQGADDAIQTLQMASLDPSITAQAASAGIETVKSLLSKKTKLVRVTVKADHPVLLINANEN